MATINRPISYTDGEQAPEQGYRVITLPEGIVVGDVQSRYLSYPIEHSYMSLDGSVLAIIGQTQDTATIYDIDSRTNYTALTR